MKRISLLLLLLISNYSIISCTEESLADADNDPQDYYASDGENDNSNPKEDPIGG